MRRFEVPFLLFLALLGGATAAAAQSPAGAPSGFGTTATPEELAGFFAIQPDGKSLPPGRGTADEGRNLFASACSACHGAQLQGVAATGAPALAGGRGTLASPKPLRTVESYWPYATTLFDYIKRAMPFNAPGSLTDDQVYSLVAFILAHDGIVAPDAVMDRTSLPKVAMPNRSGFQPYHGPDHSLYR